jgi:hypothetical protein
MLVSQPAGLSRRVPQGGWRCHSLPASSWSTIVKLCSQMPSRIASQAEVGPRSPDVGVEAISKILVDAVRPESSIRSVLSLKMDMAAVRNYMRYLAHTFNGAGASHDPRVFEIAAAELPTRASSMVEVPRSVEWLVPMCGHAFELIVSGRLVHADDLVLNRPRCSPTMCSARRNGEGDRGWTLSVLGSVATPRHRLYL